MPKAPPKASLAVAAKPSLPVVADFAGFGRDAIATAMNSNAALNAGLEAIGQEVAAYARTTFESAGEVARELLGARTFEDVARLQTDFVKRSLDGFIERTAKLSELGCSLVGGSVSAWGDRATKLSA
jgi:hypothetical protein